MRRRQIFQALAEGKTLEQINNPPPVREFNPKLDCDKCGKRIGRGLLRHKEFCKGDVDVG